MKQILLLLLCLTMLFGCGGGDDDGGHAPVISNLQYSPTSAQVGEGGGAITITGTVDFIDPDGDVTAGRFRYHENCGQGDIVRADFDIEGVSGIKAGTIWIMLAVDTNCPAGTYSASLTILDSQAHESNSLTATFKLAP